MRVSLALPFALLMFVTVGVFGQSHHHAPPPAAGKRDTAMIHPDRFEGTRKMKELLSETRRIIYRPENSFATKARIDMLTELVKTSPINEVPLLRELINGGQQDLAISMISNIERRMNVDLGDRLIQQRMLALAYLRQGEQDNCVIAHTSGSCLFPIGKGGVYSMQRGPRAAIEILQGILQCEPKDLQSRWLLNIAYMVIDEYPAGVPPQWLLDPQLFKSDCPFPKFTNVAPQLGVDEENLAGGSCTEDFDRDGDIDILASSWGMNDGMIYYRNNGDGSFTNATAESGLSGLMGGLNMIHGDYDNDGYADVLVLRGAWMLEYGRVPNSLLRNNGDGTFSDVTIETGLLSAHPTQAAAFADLNNDGRLDIFIGNESARQPHPCELWINNGNGTFTDCAHHLGLDVQSFVKGVSCGDFDNDGLTDIYLSCLWESNRLFHNNGFDDDGKWSFTDVTERAGVGAPAASFPAFFFDYDNDGWEDIYACGYGVRVFSAAQNDVVSTTVLDYLDAASGGERPRLYHNNHDGTFSDVTHAARLDKVLYGMGCNFGDIDNDGYPDIYVGTGIPDMAALVPNRMFRNNGGKDFQDVTTAGGFGHLQKGHAISFADLDNDGDQDVYAVMGGAYEGDRAHKVLFENPGNGNHWITLMLEGVKSNRSAIGARIMVRVATPSGERSIYSTVNTGGSFGSSTLQQEIGLGDATEIRSITIDWPTSETQQVFKNTEMDHFYAVREETDAPFAVDRTVLHLGGGNAGQGGMMHHHHE